MVKALIVVEGQNVSEETLKSISLGNAKQVLMGRAEGFGMLMHIEAESLVYFNDALREFAQVSGVTGLLTLAFRTK